MFFTYKEVDSESLCLGNSLTFKVLGIKKVIMKMNFEKFLTLKSMLHVINIKKNLIINSLLKKNSFKMIF
jgi:hypothetical protein